MDDNATLSRMKADTAKRQSVLDEISRKSKAGDAMQALKRIRMKCLDCCCGSAHEVRMCPSDDCPLWALRFGHYPKDTETNTQD